jgi:MFS family permease
VNKLWNHTTQSIRKLNPQHNRWTLLALLLSLLLAGQIGFAFAQGTGVPILDQLLDLIDQYKLGIAMIGIAVVAVGLLARPIAPEWSSNNRSAIASMVIGGILLTMLAPIAGAIVGG